MGLRIGLISTAIFSVRSSSSPGKHWIEAWVAGNFFNESSKFNLCFLRKRRKWKMLSDTERILLFSPLRSLGLISNAYCYTLFHRSYFNELRLNFIGIAFTMDFDNEWCKLENNWLSLVGKITNTFLAFTWITCSCHLVQWIRFLGLFSRLLFLKSLSTSFHW